VERGGHVLLGEGVGADQIIRRLALHGDQPRLGYGSAGKARGPGSSNQHGPASQLEISSFRPQNARLRTKEPILKGRRRRCGGLYCLIPVGADFHGLHRARRRQCGRPTSKRVQLVGMNFCGSCGSIDRRLTAAREEVHASHCR
jgi:hypothetical protein